MRKTLERWANKLWYEDLYISTWLSPLAYIYIDVVRFRRYLYKKGIFKSTKLSVPVIVVGNITVGGTGKTPLVVYLAQRLQKQGFKPGVVTRGYGGNNENWPLLLDEKTRTEQAGDEAVLIYRQSGCPVAAAPLRAEAAQLLLDEKDCDLILTDDGLQHYALQRDIEIVVIDGERRFGNNFFLPCGPLREPQNRIKEVDFVISNGGKPLENEVLMTLAAENAENLATHGQKALSEFKRQNCHALAGIGNPQRFFNMLATLGLKTENHVFPDHHAFKARDINFDDDRPVLMTEKDAVKCRELVNAKHWAVPVSPKLPDSFLEELLALIKQKHGQKTT